MAKKQENTQDAVVTHDDDGFVNLGAVLSKKKDEKRFNIWLVGDTPLITHAWSEKAKREMLSKQVKATKPGKEARDPEQDFVNSLYDMGDGSYGFPAMGVKNCIVSSAHKDKGIARTAVEKAIWLDAQMVRTRPALAGAICDMPLLRIFGDKPAMREDMVKVGSGLNKTATLAYRAQFTVWALNVTGKFNASVLSSEAFAFLIEEAGSTSGIGEWRNERKGMFGAFHLADLDEQAAWDAFASGKGPLPVPHNYRMAAE
jgi:hypothetical protein